MPPRRRNWGWAIRPPRHTVLFDACVLYPAPLRDLLIELAATGLFRARWTNAIHEEWIGSLLRRRPDLRRERLQRTRALMDEAVMDCLVEGYEPLIPSLALPDEQDRHVLAAAIHAQACAIVTTNLADFPGAVLAPFAIEALHPDDFVHRQLKLDGPAVLDAVRRVRGRLANPPVSAEDYVAALEALGLARTAAALRRRAAAI